MTLDASHHRKSIRLAGHDYASTGAYYITVNVHNRQPLLGTIADGQMRLNALGEIVRNEWERTGEIRPGCELDAFIVMPDHFHAIVWIHDSLPNPDNVGGIRRMPLRIQGANRDAPVFPVSMKHGPSARSLGAIVTGFKSACTRNINIIWKTSGIPAATIWQRNFYERIIRTERELENVRRYIRNNPAKWKHSP